MLRKIQIGTFLLTLFIMGCVEVDRPDMDDVNFFNVVYYDIAKNPTYATQDNPEWETYMSDTVKRVRLVEQARTLYKRRDGR